MALDAKTVEVKIFCKLRRNHYYCRKYKDILKHCDFSIKQK